MNTLSNVTALAFSCNSYMHRKGALKFGLGRQAWRAKIGVKRTGFFFAKVRSKELKIVNILKVYEL